MSMLKVVGVLASIVIALVSVAGLMQMTDDFQDMHVPVTDAVRHEQAGWMGRGQFPDLDGDTRKIGEVFDSTMYFTSWSVTGMSEKVIVGGQYTGNDDWFHCSPDSYRYKLYTWDEDEDDWETLVDDQIPDGKWSTPAPVVEFNPSNTYDAKIFNFKLDGLYPDGGTIRVVFQLHCALGDWVTMTVDEARLLQGDGDLTWGADVYTVGEDDYARLSWFVPAVDSEVEDEGAYTVFVTNENTGDLIHEEEVTKKSGTIKIPMTEDMAEEDGANRLIGRLWNNIFQKDVTHVPVRISGGFKAPGHTGDVVFPVINEITLDKPEYLEGDSATVTIDATNGTYPISHYFILCEIEGTEVVNTETNDNLYTFRVGMAGIVECEATAYDIYGNPSSKRSIKATVDNALLNEFCDRYPNDPACGEDEGGLDLVEIVILILLSIVLFAITGLTAWIVMQLDVLPWWLSIVIIVVVFLVGVALVGALAMDFMASPVR